MDTRWSCRGCWMRKPSYRPSTQCDESTMAFRRRPETSQSRDSGQISVCITHSFAFSNRSFCIAPIRGCVPGKGTHGAKTAIEKWIRKDPKHTKYVLKLDVRKCYPTMNHEELRKKLQRRIKDKKFLRLADRIIASFQQPMATHERLLPETDAVGIPVGLFTSPWFCNFFFQDIDHKVAEKTGAAHNVRYVDDMVLFDSSKRRLHKALEFIEAEVKATKQTVKDNWQVFILSKRPLDFLGFKFHPNKTTIRKSIMLRISRKARTIARAAYASIRNAHAMVSYIGYIVNSDSQRFYEKWVRPFVNIKHLKGVIADEDRKQHQACVAV